MKSRTMLVVALALTSLACTTGEGEGRVYSKQLFVENCWDGEFDLQPSFFGGNPFREQALVIRVQRGDNLKEVSDGLNVLISDLQAVRNGQLGQAIKVGPPPGIVETFEADPSPVTLILYLHDSCHEQNGTLYSVEGTITFSSLFSGDPNEDDADDRLTEAEFSVEFVNPGDYGALVLKEGEVRTSMVEGEFSFFFQRGQPAQPFP
jgi:hypothetical protein